MKIKVIFNRYYFKGLNEDSRKRARITTYIIIAIVVTVVISTSVLVPMIIKMTKDKSENGKIQTWFQL